MLPAFVLCMVVQVYPYSRNQLPTTPEAVSAAPAETSAPPAAPAEEPAPAPSFPEEPGPGDFLDEFAKRLTGYTAKEIQARFDRELLDKDGTPELSKLNAKIHECRREYDYEDVFRSAVKYDVLSMIKRFFVRLSTREYSRAEVLDIMRSFWSALDSDLQQELRSDFPAFELLQ
ncbi:hypothetical protein GCK32_017626 [Trichostrongylus colubriformis]|uniref:Uncharacterized protein n=1 Tax=Trichostrongylus colubriformis TaxID=6319 RepID=A0AAN8FV55_TRICO